MAQRLMWREYVEAVAGSPYTIPDGAREWIAACRLCADLPRRRRTWDQWDECVHCFVIEHQDEEDEEDEP